MTKHKWKAIFDANPKPDGITISDYLRQLAVQEGTTFGNMKSKYHRHVTSKQPLFQKLPKSDENIRNVLHLDGKKLLILSDIHIPYQNNKAISLAVEKGIKEKCDAVLLNGDIMDCYELSRFEKSKYKRSFIEEVQMTKQFLSWLRFKFPSAHIYYKIGNHEDRIRQYIIKNANAFEGHPSLELEALLDFERFGIDIIQSKELMNFSGMAIIHGHEFGSSTFSPVSVARGLYNRAKVSACCGHSHVTSSHFETNIYDETIECYSIGCLSELRPDYQRFSKYNYGFAIITRKQNNKFKFDNYRIENNTII